MSLELRLYEDTPFANEEIYLAAGTPRALYVSAGRVEINGTSMPEDEGVASVDALSIKVGSDGATLWRWEVVQSASPASLRDQRDTLRLSGRIDPGVIAEELLIRLDSVAFPAGGCALLHTHQGPGIRCLRDGAIRIDTEELSSAYGPGGAWFEGGPEPVFAQASMDRPSRFIRAMVLPRALLGSSSIRYVNEDDRNKPKSQSYRVFSETPIELK